MGCALSCSLKFAVQLFNAILCMAFMAVGIFGIILVSSASLLQSMLQKMLDVGMVQPEHMHELVHFIAGNVGGIACILVVVSFCIAALCLVGCISSCCGCNLLFKVYTAILAALLLAQIIAVIVIFADPHRLAAAFVESTKELLAFYGNDTRPGEAVSAIWRAIMGLDGKPCCGMDGYTDFREPDLPVQCCESNASTCTVEGARQANITGCRDKLVDFARNNQVFITHVCIGAILPQVVLIVIVFLAICL